MIRKNFKIIFTVALLLSITAMAEVNKKEVDKVETNMGAERPLHSVGMLIIGVTVGGFYLISQADQGNNIFGALYLLPVAAGPHFAKDDGRWGGYTMWGGFAVMSYMNFAVWKPEKVSKNELLGNNFLGLSAVFLLGALMDYWEKSLAVAFIPTGDGGGHFFVSLDF
jgi:hypothetical protein